MPKRFDIDHGLLLALDALLKEQNVTKAAASLRITQSSLSARLTRLRALFEDPLFVTATSGRGVVPTLRALELQDDVSDLLERIARAVRGSAAFEAATSERTFVIATRENPAVILGPGLITRVTSLAPGVRLAFVLPSSTTRELLEKGENDLLLSGGEEEGVDLMKRKLFDDRLMVAQRKGHPRGSGPFDLDAYCDLPHLIVSTDGGGFSGSIDDVLAALGRSRRVAVSIQNYSMAPMVLTSSDCICTLPKRLLQRFQHGLDLLDPPFEAPPFGLSAIWHRRSQLDAGHAWLRERLYEAALS